MFFFACYDILMAAESQEGVGNFMAQKNVLRYVILGILSKQECAGYDIKKLFEGEIGDFWSSNHSQIYPELKKMEDAGLITSRTEIVGTKLEKRFYQIAEEGRCVLKEWQQEPLGPLLPSKDEFAMKLYLMDDAGDPEVARLLNEELARHKEKLCYLKTRWATMFPSEAEERKHYGHAALLSHAIERETQYVDWLHRKVEDLPHHHP